MKHNRFQSVAGPDQNQIQQILLCYQSNDWDATERALLRLVKEFPGHPFGWKALGVLSSHLQRLQAAENFMRRALKLDPLEKECLSNLGMVLARKGKLDEAASCHLSVIRLAPTEPLGYLNLGNILMLMGCLEDATVQYLNAIALSPSGSSAYANLATVYFDLGQLTSAELFCIRAITITPDQSESWNTLGNSYRGQGSLQRADKAFKQAMSQRPEYAEAYSNLGVVLREMSQFQDAMVNYRRALRIRPELIEARSNLLYLMSSQGNMSDYLDEAKEFGRQVSSARHFRYMHWSGNVPRIRIGFVSGDFRNHPVGYFFEGFCHAFDDPLFEFVGFSSVPDGDDLTERLRKGFTSWFSIYGLSDAEAAAIIYNQNIDILIDLSGHTAHHRLGVFSYRPARVQGSWLGYWASTGVEEIDFILGDPHVTPPEDQKYFTEAILRLPHTRFCFTPPSLSVLSNVRSQLERGQITFGCFSNLFKITPEVLQCWSRILLAIPNSSIFLKAPGLSETVAIDRISQMLQEAGIGRNRVLLEGPSQRDQYLEAYNGVDIVLDTFPYAGGTTTCEALWMGVPVLTLRGDTLLSRQGVGILNNAGLADWIAVDERDYVEKAIRFSLDPNALLELKRSLRATVEMTPIFDAKAFARDFTDVMRQLVTDA